MSRASARPQKWGIWCQVWGGVTGHREAWMKNREGKIAEFDTIEAAQEEARMHAKTTMGNPHRGASFSYSVRPLI
jgi:hypothetical protein